MAEKTVGNVAEFTVYELSIAVKRTVEDAFGLVRLRGEISGYRGPHSSGHAYFALKDDRAKIDAVIWKGNFRELKFKPEEGLEVIATGRLTTFPGKSSYQLIIESLEPAGIGALMALLEERKKKLAAEGLFDEARKRPLPFLPRVVGIVTSPTGAVIRDMLHGFDERFPARVLLWPVRVQGDTCAAEVARAIQGFNRLPESGAIPRPDVLIVARGGGSLEDLWGFNEEIVARAVAASGIPVISAVGHETDWTLIDLVADARAPTPTKAAEWAVPKHIELITRMAELRERQRLAVMRLVDGGRSALKAASRGLPRPQDMLAFARQRFDGASGRLGHALKHFAAEKRSRLERWRGRLDVRLIAQRVARGGERLNALDREMRQVVRRLVQERHTRLGRQAARLDIRLVKARADRTRDRLRNLDRELLQMTGRLIERRRTALDRQASRLRPGLLAYPANRNRERLDLTARRAALCIIAAVETRRRRVEALAQLLRSLSHKSVLERGFALVRDASGTIVQRAAAARALDSLELEFADSRVTVATGQGQAATPPRKQGAKASRKQAAEAPDSEEKTKDKQGQLF